MRALSEWMIFLLLLAVSTPVEAQDGTHPPPAEPGVVAERAEVAVGVQAAHFALPGYHSGDYLTFLPALRMTGGTRWWAAFVTPVHFLTYVGAQAAGVGDLTLGFGYGLSRERNLAVDVGLWSLWPLGDVHEGLGSGHLIVAPEVDAAWTDGRFLGSVSFAVRGAIPWDEHGLHRHQPMVAPHDLLDARLSLRGGVRLFDRLELSTRLEPVMVFIPHPNEPIGSRVVAGVLAAYAVRAWRTELGVALPLTLNRANAWQLNGGVSVGL